MTGMKEGAGENPFSDDTDELDEMESSTERNQQTPDKTEDQSNVTEDMKQERQKMRIPYKFRRDSVQDGRNRVPLFLQEETRGNERDAQRELENRFNGDVSLTDLREAVALVGLNHLNEVEAQLEEWGYGMTFEE
jgi:hypothetical protein